MKPLMRWNSDTSFQWEWALFIPYTIKTTPYVKLIAKKFVTMNYVYETIPYTTFGANPSTEDAGQTSEIQHIWGFFLSLACIPDMWQILMLLLHVLLSSVVLLAFHNLCYHRDIQHLYGQFSRYCNENSINRHFTQLSLIWGPRWDWPLGTAIYGLPDNIYRRGGPSNLMHSLYVAEICQPGTICCGQYVSVCIQFYIASSGKKQFWVDWCDSIVQGHSVLRSSNLLPTESPYVISC